MSQPRRTATLQEKLRWAFEAAEGPSIRQIARRMVGASATQKQFENMRTQLSKWRNKEGVGISQANAIRLARAFAAEGLLLPEDYFLPPGRQDRIMELEHRVEELERRLAG